MHLTYAERKRIYKKVRKASDTECWEWTAHRTPVGYGRLTLRNKRRLVHRVVAVDAGILDDINSPLFVMHSCDNRACCNPEHLSVGTNADNMRDMVVKGRSMVGSRHMKAKLSEKDVIRIKWLLAEFGYYGLGKDLADAYGVSAQTIQEIKSSRNWGHIDYIPSVVSSKEVCYGSSN